MHSTQFNPTVIDFRLFSGFLSRKYSQGNLLVHIVNVRADQVFQGVFWALLQPPQTGFLNLSLLPPSGMVRPPSPQFGQLVQLFLNAKNVNLSNIQNDSLSKNFVKQRQNSCFVGHIYNLKTV